MIGRTAWVQLIVPGLMSMTRHVSGALEEGLDLSKAGVVDEDVNAPTHVWRTSPPSPGCSRCR
jgi:hypothetical protein